MNMFYSIHVRQRGFTMTEVMVALAIFALIIIGSVNVFIMGLRLWQTSSMDIDTMREASMGLEQLLYGANTNSPGLRQAIASDTNTVVTNTAAGWSIRFCGTKSFSYARSSRVITNQSGLVLCTNVNQSSVTRVSTNQVNVYVQVTQTQGSMIRSNDLTTSVFFRN